MVCVLIWVYALDYFSHAKIRDLENVLSNSFRQFIACQLEGQHLFIVDDINFSANGGALKFEDEFISRCMTIIGSASQHLNVVEYLVFLH